MQRSRRKFLKYLGAATGLMIASGACWLRTSRSRAARWLRVMAADARRKVAAAPVTPDPSTWSDNAITLCWIGHATVLINFYGIRILTDPVFGTRVGISLGVGTAGPKRYVSPALRQQDLPPIDLVLLSHAHMDHMDLPSLRGIPTQTQIITAKDTSDILSGTGRQEISELSWNETSRIELPNGSLEIEAVEVKHWGKRWPSERARGYNGYVLKREGKALLFGGDTAMTPLFAQLRSRGPFEAAILPIGAYQPWIWNHCNPEQAVELADLAGARYIVPVHHQTFRLSNEPMDEPIQRFVAALHREPDRIALRQIGEKFVCPAS